MTRRRFPLGVRPLLALLAFLLTGGLGSAGVGAKGSEFQVNVTTRGDQLAPAVAADASGGFTVAWVDDDDSFDGRVIARRFDGSGMPATAEITVSAPRVGFQVQPAVGSDAEGNFIVVWKRENGLSAGGGIFARRYDTEGAPSGPEFQVDTYAGGFPRQPAVAVDASGAGLVVWTGKAEDGSNFGIFGRRFDSAGTAVGAEFQVNSYTTGYQTQPAIALDDSGRFVVVWTSAGQDGSGDGVFGQRFDSAGARLGSEFQVNTYTTGPQSDPAVAADGDGEFLVVWQSNVTYSTSSAIAGRRFDSAGTPLGDEFDVSTATTGVRFRPSTSARGSGRFIATWQSLRPGGADDGVFARFFDDSGEPAGEEFRVNTRLYGAQGAPAVAEEPSGDFVVVWESWRQDGSYSGIFGQRYSGRAPTLTSPAPGATVDCSDPATIRPDITWEPDGFEVFRAEIDWGSGTSPIGFVRSGDEFTKYYEWIPSAKKWRKACDAARWLHPNAPQLFIRVTGIDRDAPPRDPARKIIGPVVTVDVAP